MVERTKARVRSEVAEIAQELVVLYQQRVNAAGLRVRRRHAVAGRVRVLRSRPRDPRPAPRPSAP
ncbi:MAG: hypothetical protein U5R31_02110 [Acidimicrobiia bacterium]|nr:hypothetical protein [Acidimicrobiia bacterium]